MKYKHILVLQLVASSLLTTIAAALPLYLVGALSVHIRAELGFSESRLGAALGLYFVAATVGSFLLGWLVERLGWSKGMRLAALAGATVMLGIANLVGSWGGLTFVLFLGGLSSAMAQPAANAALARAVPARWQGFSFGAKQAAIPVAVLLGGLAVPTLVLRFGWRSAFLSGSILAVLAAVLIPATAEAVQGAGTTPGHSRQNSRPMILLFMAIVGGLGSAAGNALGGFLVSNSVAAGLSSFNAARLLIFGSLMSLSVRLAAGWLSSRYTRQTLELLMALFGFGAVGFALLAVGGRGALILGGLIAFGAGWGWAGVFHYTVVLWNQKDPGAATGITQAGVFAGAALGPSIFGFVAEHLSYSIGWLLTAGLQLGAVGILLFVRRNMKTAQFVPGSGWSGES